MRASCVTFIIGHSVFALPIWLKLTHNSQYKVSHTLLITLAILASIGALVHVTSSPTSMGTVSRAFLGRSVTTGSSVPAASLVFLSVFNSETSGLAGLVCRPFCLLYLFLFGLSIRLWLHCERLEL